MCLAESMSWLGQYKVAIAQLPRDRMDAIRIEHISPRPDVVASLLPKFKQSLNGGEGVVPMMEDFVPRKDIVDGGPFEPMVEDGSSQHHEELDVGNIEPDVDDVNPVSSPIFDLTL